MTLDGRFTRTLVEQAHDLRQERLSLATYLEQLERHFVTREASVLAFLREEQRFARLRDTAQALLARFPDPQERPPLFGIPVGVKDIFYVDGFATRAGSALPAELFAGPEAPSVTRLKAAGALILGKTVTTEFAYFAPGQTRNPHHPKHTPGGSSSGSAAAVGAGICPLALGTQTIGSINRPAAFCGVVGYKPSYGRVDKSGVLPLATSVDHVGFFVPDAGDISLVAAILLDTWTPPAPARRPILAIPDGPYLDRASPEGRAHFEATAQRLSDANLDVKRVPALVDFDAIYARHNALVAAEANRLHAAWFERYHDLYHPQSAALIKHGATISDAALDEARAGRAQLRETLARQMADDQFDLWLSPSAPGAAPRGLDSTGDPVMNLPWTHAGLPTVTLPAGMNDHALPLGIQLSGRFGDDERCIAQVEHVAQALAR